MQSECLTHYLKELEQLNISPSAKSAFADEFCKKVLRYPSKKVPSISYPYFVRSFKLFVVKLRLLRKSSEILLLGVTNTTLVLRFMKSNKFYYVQTAKVVNILVVKDVSC